MNYNTMEMIKYKDCPGKEMASMPILIFKRKEVLLVGVGSGTCLRGIYFTVLSNNATDRFLPIVIQETEYVMGISSSRYDYMKRKIEKSGFKNIVIYISCMDVLTNEDYFPLKEELEKDPNKRVIVVSRGPLVRNISKSREALIEFLESTPANYPTETRPRMGYLPPLATENIQIASLEFVKRGHTIFVSPGGCGKTLLNHECIDKNQEGYYTRFSHLDAIFGLEAPLRGKIGEVLDEIQEEPLYLITSPIPQYIGMDGKSIADERENIIYFGGSGDLAGPLGTWILLNKLTQDPQSYIKNSKIKRTLVFGWNSMNLPEKDIVIERLKNMCKDRSFIFYTPKSREITEVSDIWCVSSEGYQGATTLSEKLNIPLVFGFPLSKSQYRIISDNFGKDKIMFDKVKFPEDLSDRSFGIIGDPMMSLSISQDLYERFGMMSKIYIYDPEYRLQKFYEKIFLNIKIHSITTEDELAGIAQNHKYWIGDPIFKSILDFAQKDVDFLSAPYPLISGRFYKEEKMFNWQFEWEEKWLDS